MLKCFGYISHHRTVLLKGKVACQLHSHEVLLTELLFENLFGDFNPVEIVAMLSSLVFQQVHYPFTVFLFMFAYFVSIVHHSRALTN